MMRRNPTPEEIEEISECEAFYLGEDMGDLTNRQILETELAAQTVLYWHNNMGEGGPELDVCFHMPGIMDMIETNVKALESVLRYMPDEWLD